MQEVLKVINFTIHFPLYFHSLFAQDLRDLDLVNRLSGGKVDLTYGRCVCDQYSPLQISTGNDSALDIFGGKLVKFDDLVKYNSHK